MEEEVKQELIQHGLDYQATMERLMNKEELLERFLKKFLKDENYKLLKKSLKEEDYDMAFRNAHTLKGLAGNLGLTPIFKVTSDIVEDLRAGKHDVVEKVEELDKCYGEILKILQKL